MDVFAIIWVLFFAFLISALDTFDIIYYAICFVIITLLLRFVGILF